MWVRGKNALVTGGAVRLGRALALALADAGAAVCIHYAHSTSDAEQTVAQIRGRGGKAVAVQADLQGGRRPATSLLEQASHALGPLDILVNSAAIFEPATLQQVDEEHFDRHMQLNLKAPLFLCQSFAVQVNPSHGGQIVNIVDWRALKPPTGHLAYTLTKAGLVALTKILAQELAPAIRVNAIAPGAILPPPDAGPGYERRLTEQIPLARMGTPADISRALLFLLESDFITGEVLSVTGGEQLL